MCLLIKYELKPLTWKKEAIKSAPFIVFKAIKPHKVKVNVMLLLNLLAEMKMEVVLPLLQSLVDYVSLLSE